MGSGETFAMPGGRPFGTAVAPYTADPVRALQNIVAANNATQLIELMRDLNLRLGLTFIFSTHDARLLEHTPRIIRLCDGRIESDTHSGAALETYASTYSVTYAGANSKGGGNG